MKFSDILDLARQGYKPSDIKELMSMETEPKTETKPETEPETKPETKPETEPDYKKLYEDTLKRLDALQKSNQRQPVGHKEYTVDNIIRDVFY